MLSLYIQAVSICGFSTREILHIIQAFNSWTFKDLSVCSHVQSHKLVHVSGVHCYMCAPCMCAQTQKRLCFCILYYTVLYGIQLIQHYYYKSRMYRHKCKNSGDVAGIAKSTSCCTVILYLSMYYKIKHVFTFVFFLCIIYVKSIISLSQYSTV